MPNYPATVNYLNCTSYLQKDGTVCDFSSFPRPFYILAYLSSGSAEFAFPEGNVSLSEGDVIFLPKGCTYRSTWHGKNILHRSVFFDTESLSFPFGTADYPIQAIRDCRAFENVFSDLCRPGENVLGQVGKFYLLLSELFPKLQGKNCPADQRMAEAVRYLDTHFTERIFVDDLARRAGYCPASFYEKFRKFTGVSPIVYKNRAAVRAAARLLRDQPDESIEAITEKLGFESATYFRCTFVSMMGKSPRAFRQEIFQL